MNALGAKNLKGLNGRLKNGAGRVLLPVLEPKLGAKSRKVAFRTYDALDDFLDAMAVAEKCTKSAAINWLLERGREVYEKARDAESEKTHLDNKKATGEK